MSKRRLLALGLIVALGACDGGVTGDASDPGAVASEREAAGGDGTAVLRAGLGGPVKVAGTYLVTTQFDLRDALPDEVSTPLNLVLKLAESPGAFMLELAGNIPVVKYVIEAIKLFSGVHEKVVMAIDEYINRWSGGLATTASDLSTEIQAALKGLKAHHRIELGEPDAAGKLTAVDTLLDLTFTYKGKDYAYPHNARATLTGTVAGNKVTLAAHTYDRGVNVGGLLVDLIDNVALPQLTGANSLGALLNQLVTCGGVGSWVWSYIANICIGEHCVYQYMDADDITKLCVNGLDFAGKQIEKRIEELDAPGMMAVSEGSAVLLEQNGATGRADTVKDGEWTLSLPVGVTTIALPGRFSGASP